LSYDFQLFHVPVGVDAASTYEVQLAEQRLAMLRRRKGIDSWGPIDPLKERTKSQFAAALIALHPDLQLFERDYTSLAKKKSMSEADARRRYRDMELNDHELGLQIILFDERASVTIPFARHGNSKATTMLRAVWACLKVLEDEGDLSTYDSQLGKILCLDSDFDAVLKTYLNMSGTVGRVLKSTPK
jgi:hypothetical protein